MCTDIRGTIFLHRFHLIMCAILSSKIALIARSDNSGACQLGGKVGVSDGREDEGLARGGGRLPDKGMKVYRLMMLTWSMTPFRPLRSPNWSSNNSNQFQWKPWKDFLWRAAPRRQPTPCWRCLLSVLSWSLSSSASPRPASKASRHSSLPVL